MIHPNPLLPDVGEVVLSVIAAFGTIVAALVVVAVLVVLVRFLLVATKAAQLYVDAHTQPASGAPAPTPLVTHTTAKSAPEEFMASPTQPAPDDLDEATVIAPRRRRTPPPAPPSA